MVARAARILARACSTVGLLVSACASSRSRVESPSAFHQAASGGALVTGARGARGKVAAADAASGAAGGGPV